MDKQIQELLAQRAELDRKIAEAQRSKRHEAVAQIRSLMAEFGLTAADIAGRGAPKKTTVAARKVPAKYRHKTTGDTWSGRGLQPKWLKAALAKGGKLSDFAV
ncbi:MAG: H-NS histone family protein [Burkholderiales bacterium]|nr:H-NS histone family protein [Burkholderiales bacterium]